MKKFLRKVKECFCDFIGGMLEDELYKTRIFKQGE